MKATANEIMTQEEIRKCLEGKSIYEMTEWTRDHAQHLIWFCGYDKEKVEAIMKPFIQISYIYYTNYGDECDTETIESFKALCIVCALGLETDCR
jgi:hypothetical protein